MHARHLAFWKRQTLLILTLSTGIGSIGTSNAVWAFNPPVDKAGPLTVRIEGPQTVTEIETPQAVKVMLENGGSASVEGEVRLQLIDRWRCEPAGTVPFAVAAGESVTVDFTLTAGNGTYAAHYPIHALARFSSGGQEWTAHPILVFETSWPTAAPTAPQVAWQAWNVRAPRTLALWRLPVHRSVFRVFDQQPQVMPASWSGSEPESRGSVRVQAGQRLGASARDAVGIHPPWFEGRAGTAWIEYPLALPAAEPIRLTFASAVTPGGTGDGVTFRVRVAPLDAADGQAGEVVFERHSAATTWEEAEVDLSRYAGRRIRLQLESHPGEKKNTAFDQSYWAEPTLATGKREPAPPFPPRDDQDAQLLGTLRVEQQDYEVRVWPGSKGLLDATVGFRSGSRQLFFRGFRVRLLGQRLDDAASAVELTDLIREQVPGGVQVRHQFATADGDVMLTVRLFLENDTLKARFELSAAPAARAWFAPHIEQLAVDRFSHTAQRVYAGHGNVLQRPESFRLAFDGHRLATSHVGFDFADSLSLVQAVDLPPEALEVDPASQHYSLHTAHNATLSFIPANDVWQASRHYRQTNGLKASAGVGQLAGRFVFDLWGGRYGQSGEQLQRAFRYGLTDAAVVWHNWQRWGYDYRLPEIYPPNPQLGTQAELLEMIEACRQAGVLFALHDNYIDLYPDAEGFSYDKNIAFSRGGTPVRAWLNEGRDAQSYRYRADQVEPFLQANLKTIAAELAPSAYFIDVWSSINPYDYWDADGRFVDRVFTRDSWARHFAWIRDLLGGAPQISESGHDQLIGWLDGAQTNHLRVGQPREGRYSWSVWDIRCEDAERTCWFDAAHHDRFILHGAGYSSRYQAGLDANLHGIYSDDYIATEFLTGHPAMVSGPFSRDVVRKYWLTQDVMRALALQTIEKVEFFGDDLHRQHIRWSGGGEVWVNRGQTDWTVEGLVLPPYGLLANVPTEGGHARASISRRDGLIVETSAGTEHLYVNGRQPAGGPLRIQPRVESFRSAGPRRIELVVQWQVDDAIPAGYRPFLHFVDASGEIVFQADYDAAALAAAQPGSTIEMPATAYMPEEAQAGQQWELRVGMYHPGDGGSRLRLSGPDDGTQRIRLGSVGTGGDDPAAALRWTPLEPAADPFLERQNPQAKPIDFGPVVTAGGCRLSVQDQALLLVPLPYSDQVGTEFTVRWDRLPWQLPRPTLIETIAEDGQVLRSEPAGSELTLRAAEGVFAFRLVARPERP